MSKKSNIPELTPSQMDVIRLTNELKLKSFVCVAAVLVFLALSITIIILAVKKYDWELLAALGGVDTLLGVIMTRITYSLFKVENK